MNIPIEKVELPPKRMRVLDEGTVRRLMSSIGTLGLLHPIIISPDRTLVAGLHRYEACRRLGHKRIEARVVDFDNMRRVLAEIDENLIRNELNPLEQGEHLLHREGLLEKIGLRAPSRRPRKGERSSPFQTTAQIAERLGLSERVAQKRKQIARALPKPVRDAVRKTAIAHSPLELLRLARLKAAKRMPIVRAIAQGKARTILQAMHSIGRNGKDVALARTRRFEIRLGDFQEIGQAMRPESVDVIVTDPPYGKEFLPFYAPLSAFAAKVLKPGGFCVVLSGQAHLPKVMASLSEHLKYWWTAAYFHDGPAAGPIWQRKVLCRWKPLLWFVKDKYEGRWIEDLVRSRAKDKEHHPLGQSVCGMLEVMQAFTSLGQLVCDPCCGAGTTGVAALMLGRRFLGIDRSRESISTAAKRLIAAAHGKDGRLKPFSLEQMKTTL